jgi:hypothetical protein
MLNSSSLGAFPGVPKNEVAPDWINLEGDSGVESLCIDTDFLGHVGLCAAVTFDSQVSEGQGIFLRLQLLFLRVDLDIVASDEQLDYSLVSVLCRPPQRRPTTIIL